LSMCSKRRTVGNGSPLASAMGKIPV
jgi:hypothetical protein